MLFLFISCSMPFAFVNFLLLLFPFFTSSKSNPSHTEGKREKEKDLYTQTHTHAHTWKPTRTHTQSKNKTRPFSFYHYWLLQVHRQFKISLLIYSARAAELVQLKVSQAPPRQNQTLLLHHESTFHPSPSSIQNCNHRILFLVLRQFFLLLQFMKCTTVR